MKKQTLYAAREVVDVLLDDLSERDGFENEWNKLTSDVQYEIRERWESLVAEKLEEWK